MVEAPQQAIRPKVIFNFPSRSPLLPGGNEKLPCIDYQLTNLDSRETVHVNEVAYSPQGQNVRSKEMI